jgi:Lon protease-like protein
MRPRRLVGVADELPIFELPLVLLPGERVPLHIFEERYKRMIGSCLENDEPFGVVLRDADGARSFGCTAFVTEVLERFDDGRLNVVVTGAEPFRVLDRFDDPEAPAAEIEVETEAEAESDLDAAEVARSAFLDLAERASGERPAEDEIAAESAYGIAARIELPVEFKQRLLQSRGEAERMQMLAKALQRLQDALERAEVIADQARSNGKVRIGP